MKKGHEFPADVPVKPPPPESDEEEVDPDSEEISIVSERDFRISTVGLGCFRFGSF